MLLSMNATDKVLSKLGDTDAAIARRLCLSAPAIHYWRKAGRIPRKSMVLILASLSRDGIVLPRSQIHSAVMGE